MFRVIGTLTINLAHIHYVEWGYEYSPIDERVISTAAVYFEPNDAVITLYGKNALFLSGAMHSPQQGEMLESNLKQAHADATAEMNAAKGIQINDA